MAKSEDLTTSQLNRQSLTPPENNGVNLTREAVLGGSLLAANASGFAAYQGVSTAAGAITSAAGVTLPFSAYTTASVAINYATGPFGWCALGTFAAYKLLS